VELHQLQCFIAVLEEGGFKRATTRLDITQPALSYQIKRLEEELEVPLFRRRPGGLAPTEAGRVLLEHAHQVVAAVREAHRAVRELSKGETSEIRIGTIACVGTYFLPLVLWEISDKHPLVRPKLLYHNSEELVEALLANRLDVALVADPAADPRLRLELVVEEKISLVSSHGHPFFGRPSVDPSELKNAQFVSLSAQSASGALVNRYLDQMGISISPVVTTDNIETVKRMVEAGMGVAFLPDMATSEDVGRDGQPDRLARSTVDSALCRRVVMATRRDGPRSVALDAFLDEVRRLGRQQRGYHGRRPDKNSLG
jgi:DNA-binding transcriptional LysR family regulator